MIGEDRIIRPDLINAIAEVQAKGVVVSIATGRPLNAALAIADHSGARGPVICFQGAMTFDQSAHTSLRHVSLEQGVAVRAIKGLLAAVSEVMVFLDEDVWVQNRSEWTDNYGKRMSVKIKKTESLESLASDRPTSIVGVGQPEVVERLVTDMRRQLNGTALVTHSLPMFCEIESVDAGKDQAVAHLAKTLEIARGNVIAVGDGLGDQSMIEWAGLGVAIKNGHPDTVAAADVVIGSPECSGLAKFLGRLCDRSL